MARMTRCKLLGYTLIEMLVVLAVVASLAAILFPLFTSVREKGRRTACLSNERQLGMALLQYVQDNEQVFPGNRYSWVSRTYPYVKSNTIFKCPDDATPNHAFSAGASAGTVAETDSYGINTNIAGLTVPGKAGKPEQAVYDTASDPRVAVPANTVLLFEVTNDVASLAPFADPTLSEGSASGNGAYGCSGWIDGVGVDSVPCGTGSESIGEGASFTPLYATGNIGGRLLNGKHRDQVRHNDGSNFVACDGHALWLRPEAVSGGNDAANSDCLQGDAGNQPSSCASQTKNSAAGTNDSKFKLTFSVK